MNGRDLCEDIAAILRPVAQGGDDSADASVEQQLGARRELAEALRAAWGDGADPLLSQVQEARRRRLQDEQDLRNLIAYAREFMHPRPYRLIDLAEAAGLSISGVRINYDKDDVALVEELINGKGANSQGEVGSDR
jgi:hypothetical protein